MGRDFKLRFAVGRPDGPQSAVWSVFTRAGKSDVYVANRQIASSIKVSLHESGVWRLAFTEQGAADRAASGDGSGDRVQHRWQRPPEVRPGWTHAVSIVVPASDVRDYGRPIDYGREIGWRAAPRPGMETHFGVFFVRGVGIGPVGRPAGEILAVLDLPNGERLCVIAVDVPSTAEKVAEYDLWRSNVRTKNGPGYRSIVFGGNATGARVMVDLYSGDE